MMEIAVGIIAWLLYFLFLFLIIFLSQLVQGVCFGLVPLICGITNKKKGLGVGGFFICIGAACNLGVYPAMAACALLTIFTLKKD